MKCKLLYPDTGANEGSGILETTEQSPNSHETDTKLSPNCHLTESGGCNSDDTSIETIIAEFRTEIEKLHEELKQKDIQHKNEIVSILKGVRGDTIKSPEDIENEKSISNINKYRRRY